MPHALTRNGLEKSLKAYSLYAVFTRAYFWTPLFVLYFSSVVTLKHVFLLEAIYYASVFILEVPSGYFSDHVGRKKTLIISALSFCVAYMLFFLGGSFNVFALAQFFLAMGFAFASGTDTALHFALLSSLKQDSEYGRREARLASWGLISIAAAAVIGGVFAWLNEYRIAYALSFAFSVLCFVLVISMKDPETARTPGVKITHPLLQMKRVFAALQDPLIKYLFIFTIIITVLNHIPYELYQVYIHNMIDSFSSDTMLNEMNPVILGIHTAISMIIASWFAHHAIKIDERFGSKMILLVVIALLIGMIAIMGKSGSYLVVVLLLLRSVPNAIASPIVRSHTTHRLPSNLRATFYSTQSLLGRLSFAIVLVIFHVVPGDGFTNSIQVGTGIGVMFLIILGILPIKDQV